MTSFVSPVALEIGEARTRKLSGKPFRIGLYLEGRFDKCSDFGLLPDCETVSASSYLTLFSEDLHCEPL